MKKALSHIFLAIGIIFILWSGLLFYVRNFSNILAFEEIPSGIAIETHQSIPKTLIIPIINKQLNIYPGVVTDDKWGTTESGVSFLATSPVPGSLGNSILYGHNWNTILGNLNKVKPGEEIIIEFSNNERKVFVVENTAVVNPTQVSVIENTTDTRLTLYTCTGFLDSKRLVVVAKPLIP